MTEPAPILLFTYKRLATLKKTIESLKNSPLASQSELHIFSDGPKASDDEKQINEVRTFLKQIEGFRNIFIEEEKVNQGLAASIINGVNACFSKYDSVIVVEDDLIVSPNFLHYMNSALNFYKNNAAVFSISGYIYSFTKDATYQYDTFLASRGCSWGWATWKDRWQKVDWNISDYPSFVANKKRRNLFASSGSDLNGMLGKQMKGTIDSWAIRLYYNQVKLNMLTVYPTISKVENIGFDEYATHTRVYNRYKTKVDSTNQTTFNFINSKSINYYYQKLIQKKFSVLQRIFFGRLLTLIVKVKEALIRGGKS